MRRIGSPIALAIALFGSACGDPEPPPPPALELLTTALPEVALRGSYDVKLEAKGGTPPYTFALGGGALPEGIELKGATGQITGIAARPGPAPFTARVSDAAGKSAARDLSIYVVPDPLEVVTTALPSGQETRPYDQPLTARGGLLPYTWKVGGGLLPAGLALAADGRLFGAPTAFGMFQFTVEVEDAEMKKAARTLDLFLSSLDPMIATSTIPKARLAQPYAARFLAEGGIPPYAWSVSSGALPAGLSLGADGGLAGAPTESGLFPFTARVEDSAGRSDEAQYALTVIPPLDIVTTAIPTVLRGRPYDFQMSASGGVPPYAWSIRSGMLPSGLTLDERGRISGMSSDTTEQMITVRVRDSEGAQKSALFTMTVNDRFIYRVEPGLAFPATCTATTVSYAIVPIEVPDSMQVDDVDVTVDISYADQDERPSQENRKLKLIIEGPDGSRAALCGNAAGIRGAEGCGGRGGMRAAYGDSTPSERPLGAFTGLNPRGRWKFLVAVAKPTTRGGMCEQRGTINSVILSIRDDRSGDPYVFVRGFTKNNLAIEPWVRLGTVPERELFLAATIYEVGPNGYREGGQGDDVPRRDALTWRFAGPAEVGTVTPDGHAVAGRRTGSGALTAEGGGMTWTSRLLVFAPDWNVARRDY